MTEAASPPAAPLDVLDYIRRAGLLAASSLARVRAGDWTRPTPCSDWNLRALTHHLIGDLLRVPRLLAGEDHATVDAVLGGGDHVGELAVASYDRALSGAVSAFAAPGALEQTVDLQLGDFPAYELAWMVFTELLIHGWDIGVSLDAPAEIPADLAVAAYRKLYPQREMLLLSGGYGIPRELQPTARAHDRLMALVGRVPDPSSGPDRSPGS